MQIQGSRRLENWDCRSYLVSIGLIGGLAFCICQTSGALRLALVIVALLLIVTNLSSAFFSRSMRKHEMLSEPDIRWFFLQYVLIFGLAGSLAFLASQTSDALSVALAVVAVLLIVATVWSILFILTMSRLLRIIKRQGPEKV
jgi:hypothetical protein